MHKEGQAKFFNLEAEMLLWESSKLDQLVKVNADSTQNSTDLIQVTMFWCCKNKKSEEILDCCWKCSDLWPETGDTLQWPSVGIAFGDVLLLINKQLGIVFKSEFAGIFVMLSQKLVVI